MVLTTDPFTRALACAAISPGLRSILVFDAAPETLRLATQTTAQMLEVVTGHQVVPVTLGTFEAEDDLWGSWGLGSELELLQWKLGLLTGGQKKSPLRLVMIPDLTKLSLAAARACVVLMGADVAHLERHGQHEQWQPNLCWLAGCASDEVGMVSPHLLDRFALRLSGLVNKNTTREAEIRELLDERKLENETTPEPLSKEIYQILQTAVQQYPKITDEALARIFNYTASQVYWHRREITLARLSLAIARLDGAAEITVEHVNTAARIIGLRPIAQQIDELSKVPAPPVTPLPEPPKPDEVKPPPLYSLPDQSNVSASSEPIYESDTPQQLEPTIVYHPVNPYPEDKAPIEREAASLRLPIRRFRSKTSAYGSIIGVEKAKNLQDLALVRTLLEAAKFQAFRQQSTANAQRRLALRVTDFHSYRRAPVAEQMLTLVMDYTCLRECNWRQGLLPYLSWAYVERASICLIQVGVAKNIYDSRKYVAGKTKVSPEELRAERILARNILVPRIAAGIEAESGKATPLAHGLDLALQTLRHALQHGRSKVQQALLVVISDGRGNVPLEASRAGKIKLPVGSEGVKNALQIAERIRDLKGVKTVLLNPQPKEYTELPLELANALGAAMVAIPLFEAVEVE
ncbi:Mg-chelatase subunit ChlI-like protein [Kalymmatonema gypsitolerans NIES-4073]|nr:Mg-chelatase subunit ChlI-like protein [Scytonema sp. NIES-4073]